MLCMLYYIVHFGICRLFRKKISAKIQADQAALLSDDRKLLICQIPTVRTNAFGVGMGGNKGTLSDRCCIVEQGFAGMGHVHNNVVVFQTGHCLLSESRETTGLFHAYTVPQFIPPVPCQRHHADTGLPQKGDFRQVTTQYGTTFDG